MADIEAPKTVESTVDEKKVEEKEKVVEKVAKDDAKVEENGEKVENGDSEDSKETPTEKSDEDKDVVVTDKCSIKRKSTGDAVDGKGNETTPEKKAKIDPAPAETESNGEVTEAEATA